MCRVRRVGQWRIKIFGWGEGGGRGEGKRSPKKMFSPLRASVWSKNKGGSPPGPSPRSATVGTYRLAGRGRVREKFWLRSGLRARKSDISSPHSSHRHCRLALLTFLPRTRTSEPARRFPLSRRRPTTTSAKSPRGNTIEGYI